jgi:thermitase
MLSWMYMVHTRFAMTMWRRAALALLLASILVFLPLLAVQGAGQADAPIAPARHAAPATWLGRSSAGAPADDIPRALRRHGIDDARYYPDLDVWALPFPSTSAAEARTELVAAGLFEWITPNPKVSAAETPNDPYFLSHQWNLPIIEAPAAWDIATGSTDVIIAILDTGILLNHPDLASRIWVNEGEIAGNGVDDDSNGFVDDRWGWNFYAEWANTNDDHGHGTHVAGIAGAIANNGVGIAGVNWGSPLMAVKFLDASGHGDFLAMLQGMTYAIDNGARVLNLSVTVDGGSLTGEQKTLLSERVAYATAHGALVVGASGNQGRNSVSYPAAYPDVLSVGATTSADFLWNLSNYGEELDLVAPGSTIYSTYVNWSGNASYALLSGTSMATPHVAGAAALLWGVAPGRSPVEIRQILRATADDVNGATLPGPDQWMGSGRLNLRRAVQAAATGQIMRVTPPAPVFRVLGDPVTITATVSTGLGEPVADGTIVTFSTDIGSLSAGSVETLAGIATTQFSGCVTPGAARLDINAGAITETIEIQVLPGAPQHIDIATAPETVLAGDGVVTVTLSATDGASNPVSDGTALTFAVSAGSVYPTRAVTFGGQAQTALTPPEVAGPLTLEVRIDSTWSVTRSLLVGPAAADHMTIETADDWLWAGESSVPITVTARDRFGNLAVDGQSIALQATRGDVWPAVGLTQAGVVTGTLTGTLPRGQVCLGAWLDDLSASRCLSVFAPAAWFPRLVAGTENP